MKKLSLKSRIFTIFFSIFTFTAFSTGLLSCMSTPVMPEKASATQLIQLGQDAAELGNYKAAEAYYLETIRRYGVDTAIYIETRYELGHLYLNQKKYDQAYTSFNEILEIYANAEYGSVPGSFKKLSQIGLERIPEKYTGK